MLPAQHSERIPFRSQYTTLTTHARYLHLTVTHSLHQLTTYAAHTHISWHSVLTLAATAESFSASPTQY